MQFRGPAPLEVPEFIDGTLPSGSYGRCFRPMGEYYFKRYKHGPQILDNPHQDDRTLFLTSM
jgi:hypothetical protein